MKKLYSLHHRVSEIGFLDTRNGPKNGSNVSWTRLFFIFLPNFLAYLWIFQSFAVTGKFNIWKIIKYGKQNEEMSCSTCLQPISPWHCIYLIPRFWVEILLNQSRDISSEWKKLEINYTSVRWNFIINLRKHEKKRING